MTVTKCVIHFDHFVIYHYFYSPLRFAAVDCPLETQSQYELLIIDQGIPRVSQDHESHNPHMINHRLFVVFFKIRNKNDF